MANWIQTEFFCNLNTEKTDSEIDSIKSSIEFYTKGRKKLKKSKIMSI